MNTMAPTRPTERHRCRIRLTARPAAAAEARSQVSELIWAWQPPVDPDVAVLLTSDLVTNALRHTAGGTITLAVRCGHGQLRVDVDGATGTGSPQADTRADAQIGPGLILIATLPTSGASTAPPRARPCTSRSRSSPAPPTTADAAWGKHHDRSRPVRHDIV